MNKTQQQVYDVLIMGAGFAGICQARHLLLNLPNIKVAIIDPRSPERSIKDLKIGESTVEISSMFMCKELALHEYLLENHAPKYGLNYHWPKNQAQTKSVNDYYHMGFNRTPLIDSFHINRAKFEQDVLQMTQEMGATFYNGRVIDVELTPCDQLHTVTVKLDQASIELKTKHVIDAAGRRFIIGKKLNNVILDSEEMTGINTGSAWLRVKNIDLNIFDNIYNKINGTASSYYSTKHFFGTGHWIWVLPIDTKQKEISIGLVHHKNSIAANQINTSEKLKSFFKANHEIVYNLIESGQCIDFNYLPRLAHNSKQHLSQDNWYVIGDAAQMFDPLYSPGLVVTALGIECVTEVIRAKLAKEPEAEKKQDMYNKFMVATATSYSRLYQNHEKHLGHASVMSWRIYMENMFWFGNLVPMYIGKWFLDFHFINEHIKAIEFLAGPQNSLFSDLHQQFDQLVECDANLGIMDFARTDQLLWGYGPSKYFDNFLENSRLDPHQCNVLLCLKNTFFFLAVFYLKLRFKGFGIWGGFAPKTWIRVTQLLSYSFYIAIGEKIYRFKVRQLNHKTFIEKMRQEFKTYQYQPKLHPWN